MTLMWMGLLVVVLVGAGIHALNTKYHGVGDFYYVTLRTEEAGRLVLRFECSDSNKSFSLVLISNGLENVLDEDLNTSSDSSTTYLSYDTGKHFYTGIMNQIQTCLYLSRGDRQLKERLLIVHDLIALIYRQQATMRITDKGNFKVGYRAARCIKALGRIP
ncbi:hypothetical protein FDJ25_gp023 [Vibrio phage Aphrodite1]|uniref:Uncharacterized protein n=1 Tax=Vibrio phage Aphrodite1 TaxID=2070057 RepID=A0A2I7QI30_9CAUD|nr:hypothetical protein FDJ25_gp023 [Vibrio phage Aphrodite1]AUR81049.1 hypothetical protein Aphrodite1_0187 [Vibrio phage Aphrodite1]